MGEVGGSGDWGKGDGVEEEYEDFVGVGSLTLTLNPVLEPPPTPPRFSPSHRPLSLSNVATIHGSLRS